MNLDALFAVEALPYLETKPRRREKSEVVWEQPPNLCHLSVSRSTGRKNDKGLVETEVGAKEDKEADWGGRKVSGGAEWGLQKTDEESEKKSLLLLPNLKLSSFKLVQAETLIIFIQTAIMSIFIVKSYGHKDLQKSGWKSCL